MQEHKDNHDSFFRSRGFQLALYFVLAVVVLLLTFRTGMIVGYQKAVFSFHSSENYEQIFLGGDSPLPPMTDGGFFHDNFSSDHGTVGTIMQINGDTLVLKGPDQGRIEEKSVLVDDDTLIKRFQDTIATSDLKIGDTVVVIGDPNDDGQIQAELIRYISPPISPGSPPSGQATSSAGTIY